MVETGRWLELVRARGWGWGLPQGVGEPDLDSLLSVGSHQHCLLQENSTEGLAYLSCCSANRFIFQLRSFFGPILLRLGTLLFHNSFPAATSTFYALLDGHNWYPVALWHDMQNPFVFQRLNLTNLKMQILGTLTFGLLKVICPAWLCTLLLIFFHHLFGLKCTF